jgi:putative ABC transport system substrate-binding protein
MTYVVRVTAGGELGAYTGGNRLGVDPTGTEMAAVRCALSCSRRAFVQGAGVAGLGFLAGCGRLPVQVQPQSQQSSEVHRIGYLATGPNDSTAAPAPGTNASFDAFLQGLREYGYVEGQNLVIEYRASVQGEERLRELADELVRLPVDLILAMPAIAAVTAQKVTTALPIVFAAGIDPVALGLVASLAHPGGNVTGVPAEVQDGSLFGKRLELLKDVVPGLLRVAVLGSVNLLTPEPALAPVDVAAQALGLQVQRLAIRTADELPSAFETAAQSHADGLLNRESGLLARHRAEIADLALKHRLPSISLFREFAEAGGLMSYGPSITGLTRRAAYYVDRILKGAKPADLPVEQPTTFDFVLNLKTAQALGLTIPEHVLLQATEVIQ